MIELRPYQQESIDAVMDFWAKGGGNPLVDLATGLGKSVVIAKLVRDLVTHYPQINVLMLVHVRELVEQNFMALMRLWPSAPAGIYSAGLGRKDTHRRIIFGSIQSLYRQDGFSLGHRDLVLIDEAHLVPAAGEGMYRTLINKLQRTRPDMRIAGFTATPFRLDSGRLDAGDGRLFDEVVYSYGIAKGIEDGWLSPLVSKSGLTEIDVSGVAKRGGEFVAGALEAAADRDEVTRAACAEMLRYGSDRRSWLVFCSGVKHAYHTRDALRAVGVAAETITGDTHSGDRTRIIRDFRAGRIRALTNAQVLTTGFDAPSVDLIAFLRPTLSTGLYVQMCGRGTRLAEGKGNCLVLDFAGNVRRHGPVDTVEIRPKTPGKAKEAGAEVDEVRAKTCPNCGSLAPLNARACRDCDHVWSDPAPTPKHEREADDTPILSAGLNRLSVIDDAPVVSWLAARHEKAGAPDSMRVTYFAGLLSYPEWVCFEHGGFAQSKAQRWWKQHGGAEPIPATVTEALERFRELQRPEAIQTRKNGRWHEIVGRRFAQPPSGERAA